MTPPYTDDAPARTDLDQLPGPTVVEFGANWCSHCQAAQPLIAEAFGAQPQLRHLKIEDGPGRALGRAFAVKLWPTLVFLRDGQEVERLVRPTEVEALRRALAHLAMPA